MGTVKKKPAAPAPAAVPSTRTPAPPDPSAVLGVLAGQCKAMSQTAVQQMVEIVRRTLDESSGPSMAVGAAQVVIPQALLQSVLRLRLIVKIAKSAEETMADLILQHHKAGGSFEDGPVQAAFEAKGGSNPSWKEEALSLAKELFTFKGTPFVEEAFVAEVQAKYQKTPETRLKLSEADG
jgi:hypothetical protein